MRSACRRFIMFEVSYRPWWQIYRDFLGTSWEIYHRKSPNCDVTDQSGKAISKPYGVIPKETLYYAQFIYNSLNKQEWPTGSWWCWPYVTDKMFRRGILWEDGVNTSVHLTTPIPYHTQTPHPTPSQIYIPSWFTGCKITIFDSVLLGLPVCPS